MLLCLGVLPAACAAPPAMPATGPAAAACAPGAGAPMTAFELFFGRSIRGAGEVSDSAWQDFLARVVTPNLPNGYTVFDGVGAWLDPVTGKTLHERTNVLLAVLPNGPAGAAAIARVRQSYQTEFHQMLVGMTVMPVCGAF